MRLTASLILSLAALPAIAQTPSPRYSNKLAPYVASPAQVVDRMLEMARIKPGETLYDLGCGDGRILIAAVEKYKVKAVDVEISPKLVTRASNSIAKAGLENRAKVIQGDLLNVDFSGADVVTIYLATPLNEQLRPRLEKYLKPGARVVSHDYEIPGWKPTRTDKTDGPHGHLIFLYEIPATKL